ncbi:MAG: methyl-accepting chemotaxis protein [Oscillatoriaceae bacterium SKW80]|nr:methyl-accepting chemotaxis protein [Oscillatoriaceae bacterium SKYG93]MCX8121869.1 methyl-accepting chemotaxis protein [Oscillatoriaceae bacterium SKW80]MDW8454630.1 methyl-accepting chemotaxis protein [Oscillatoriaceae cyanobacterium SKYGB_i_bin93]HIK27440.1 CHASE3 domain-containing protein [Oscillatoriaceae cyanobacterium M7585_C2015_266]
MAFQWKIKERLLFGYIIPVLVFLGLTGFVYTSFQKIFADFKEVEQMQQAIITSNKIALKGHEMIASLRGFLLLKDEDFIGRYQKAFKEFKETIAQANKINKAPLQQQRIEKMKQLVKEYDEVARERIRLSRQGKEGQAKALLLLHGKGRKTADELIRLNEEFNQTEVEFLERQNKQAKEVLNSVVLILLIGAGASAVIATIVAYIISYEVAEKINQATNAIATSSSQIAATIEEQEKVAFQQATSVNQTTTTINELGASSQQAAQQAENAAALALQILMLVEGRSQNLIEGEYSKLPTLNALNGNLSLRENVEMLAQQIIRLSHQTSQIGNISGMVSELASQTNILALNAAVEAVRAGENGRGFAVVASEIRKLAEQSKKSALDINAIVSDIQNAVTSTVSVTNDGKKTLDTVIAAINDIVVNNQQIALNSKQQAVAIQQVIEAINAINNGAKQTASGISQTKIGIQNLNQTALNLKSVV